MQLTITYVPIGASKFVIAIEAKSGRHAPYVYDVRAFERN
jgi:hypothetical protein